MPAKLLRAVLPAHPWFAAMRGVRGSTLKRRTIMLRRVLIGSAAAALLLVTAFHSDDAFARRGAGVRGGGFHGGAVGVRGGAVGVRGGRVAGGYGYRGGYRGGAYRGYRYGAGAAVGAAALGAAAYGAYNRGGCGYDSYGNWVCQNGYYGY